MKRTVKIDGMTCEHCVTAIKAALEGGPGVETSSVEIGKAKLELKLHGPEEVLELEEEIIAAVVNSGYKVLSIK